MTHVRQILGILNLLGVDGKQILASGLLPIGKASALEFGDTNFSKVLLDLFLLFEFFPLILGHSTRCNGKTASLVRISQE